MMLCQRCGTAEALPDHMLLAHAPSGFYCRQCITDLTTALVETALKQSPEGTLATSGITPEQVLDSMMRFRDIASSILCDDPTLAPDDPEFTKRLVKRLGGGENPPTQP